MSEVPNWRELLGQSEPDGEGNPGVRLVGLLIEIYGEPVGAIVHLNGLVQGLQLALAHPEWAHAFTRWAEGHVNNSGGAYPKLDPEYASLVVELCRIEVRDNG